MPVHASSGRAPLLAFLASRLALLIAAYAILTRFPVHTIEPWQAQVFPGHNWIDGWIRWDSFWYESIVDGTARLLPQDLSNANFFPFYAWVSWLCAWPFRLFLDYPQAFYAGGLLVSSAAFACGLVGVFRVAEARAGRDVAERAVWLMALFPFSFFFSAVYSDALYLALAVWSFRSAQAARWTLASLLATLATLTRVTGFALIAALAVEFLRTAPPTSRSARGIAWPVAILMLSPVILGAYFSIRYDDPLAFLHARQVGWQRATGFAALIADWHTYTDGSLLSCGGVVECLRGWDLTRKVLGMWYIALPVVGSGLVVAARRTLGSGLVAWVLASYAMALLNGLDGMGRFSAVLFPIFISAAILLRSRAALVTVCAAFVPFLVLFLGGFVRWRAVL